MGGKTQYISADANKWWQKTGDFVSTLDASLDVNAIESLVGALTDVDGIKSGFSGYNKIFRMSSTFTLTIDTSVNLGSISTWAKTGLSDHSDSTTIWCSLLSKLWKQSGDFTTTVLDSIDTSIFNLSGIVETVSLKTAINAGGTHKRYSGDFQATIDDSFVIEAGGSDIYDHSDGKTMTGITGNVKRRTGDFTSTVDTSIVITGINPHGFSEVGRFGSGGESTPTTYFESYLSLRGVFRGSFRGVV
jgi:hypothetical protein